MPPSLETQSSHPPSQPELKNFFSSPHSLGHNVSNFHTQETHLSSVFLTGEWVYKVKKSVTLPFIDLKSLASRRYFTERELRLNKRISPKLYDVVLPLYRSSEGLTFTPSGAPVEYCLRMKQFDEKKLFLNMFEKGELSAETLLDLGALIYKTQSSLPLSPGNWTRSQVNQNARDSIEECHSLLKSQLTIFQSHEFRLELFEEIGEVILQQLKLLGPLLEKRAKTHVGEYHGDLHLQNICEYENQTTFFDCLEIGDKYSVCDSIADLAFVTMDLDSRSHEKEARFPGSVVLSSYLEHSNDFEGLTLLSFYESYRALVRLKVTLLESETKEPAALLKRTLQLIHFLERKTLSPSQPLILAIGGFSGSGKSTLARRLLPYLDAVILRSDAIRKHLFDIPLDKEAGEHVYSAEANKASYTACLEKVHTVIKSGRTAIVDATHIRSENRIEIERLAEELQVPFQGLWCVAPTDVITSRLKKRTGDVSDADVSVYQMQQKRELGPIEWRMVRTDTLHDTTEILREIPSG